MTWMTQEQKDGLAAAAEAVKQSEVLVKDIVLILATMMLTNAVLTGSQLKPTKAYVMSKFKVQVSALPFGLKAKIALADSEGGSKPGAAEPGGSSEAPDAEQPERTKKKFRRMASSFAVGE